MDYLKDNFSVSIIGLGYIGLPTAALIAKHEVEVKGCDLNKDVVDTINKGNIHIKENELEDMVSKVVKKGCLKAYTKVQESDVYLIVVPTPFTSNHEPDISYVKNATQNVIPLLKEGDLYIIESTSPIGTTEKMAELIFNARPELKDKIYLAYCPERVLPGNIVYELINNDRVVGGIDKKSTLAAKEFYQLFVKANIHETNARTAEMCKLTENSFRDIEIAFANELSVICDKAGIDVWDLISLANKHPRVNILRPGCGVGGHCIAVDPWFLVSSYPKESTLIAKARELNNYKSFWCAEKIKEAKSDFKLKTGKEPVIGLFGLAFKPNIDDLRESPAKYIVQKILQDSNNDEIFIVEPNIKEHNVFKLTNKNTAWEKSDILVLLVAHDEFKKLPSKREEQVLLDFCGINKG